MNFGWWEFLLFIILAKKAVPFPPRKSHEDFFFMIASKGIKVKKKKNKDKKVLNENEKIS